LARAASGAPSGIRRHSERQQAQTSHASLIVAVAAIGLLYAGNTIATPLYPLYRRAFGFSELVVTQIYAAYVLGNLSVLFFFGRVPDQLGRRSPTFTALGLTSLSALCFLVATSAVWLYAARITSGFAVGLGASSLTAWIAELEPRGDRARAAVLASSANLAGLALGALGAGLLAQYFPAPLRASYILYLLALSLMAAALLGKGQETIEPSVKRLTDLSMRPRIGVPHGLRISFIAPAALAFAVFALGGFYAALAPSLLSAQLGHPSPAATGALVALLFGAACGAAALLPGKKQRRNLVAATALLLLGLGALLLADAFRSLPLLVSATAIGGLAVGLGFRASLAMINQMAPAESRAELVSSYLLVCYTANAFPVLGVGLSSRALGPETTHRVFAALLAALGLLSAGVGIRHVREAE
jgi:MFS family permease